MFQNENSVRDHLFISYAYEDAALADWLVRRLTAEGYRVWCDRFKLLGGESYPRDIDLAIKNETFRVIALLSRHSIHKPNPLKERTLALNLARVRHDDFVIPLNVDGLRAVDLDWMTSDLTFIPFNESWAAGLRQLLSKLESLSAPRSLNDGPRIAAATFPERGLIRNKTEVLYSNQLPLLKIPEVIRRFRFARPIERGEAMLVSQFWAFYYVDRQNVLAFQPPSKLPRGLTVTSAGGTAWRYQTQINGIPSINVLLLLLKRSLIVHCISKGLLSAAKDEVYFPTGFSNDGRLHFLGWDDKQTWVQVAGERSIRRLGKPPEPYRYHLSLRFSIQHKLSSSYSLQIRLRLHITNTAGEPLPSRSAVARRKAICRSWWNDKWLKRLLAICSHLSNGDGAIEIGIPGDEQVVLSAHPIQIEIPVGINEDALGIDDREPSLEESDIATDEGEGIPEGEIDG